MQFKKLKQEVIRISKIKDPKEALREIRDLAARIQRKKLEAIPSGNKIYFYEIENYYDPNLKRSSKRSKSLGTPIHKMTWETHKKRIDSLLADRDPQKLKDFLQGLE
ncbi:MAG: hypothetical protein R6U96_18685 [Promethearchaeia archaeon]